MKLGVALVMSIVNYDDRLYRSCLDVVAKNKLPIIHNECKGNVVEMLLF